MPSYFRLSAHHAPLNALLVEVSIATSSDCCILSIRNQCSNWFSSFSGFGCVMQGLLGVVPLKFMQLHIDLWMAPKELKYAPTSQLPCYTPSPTHALWWPPSYISCLYTPSVLSTSAITLDFHLDF